MPTDEEKIRLLAHELSSTRASVAKISQLVEKDSQALNEGISILRIIQQHIFKENGNILNDNITSNGEAIPQSDLSAHSRATTVAQEQDTGCALAQNHADGTASNSSDINTQIQEASGDNHRLIHVVLNIHSEAVFRQLTPKSIEAILPVICSNIVRLVQSSEYRVRDVLACCLTVQLSIQQHPQICRALFQFWGTESTKWVHNVVEAVHCLASNPDVIQAEYQETVPCGTADLRQLASTILNFADNS